MRLARADRDRLNAMRAGIMQVFAEERAGLGDAITVAAQVLIDILVSGRENSEIEASIASQMHEFARKLDALADARPDDMRALLMAIADEQADGPHGTN